MSLDLTKDQARPFHMRAERYECDLGATALFMGYQVPCRVTNISESGLGMEMTVHLMISIGDRLRIQTAEFGDMTFIVRWYSYPRYGLERAPEQGVSKAYRTCLDVCWAAANSLPPSRH